ncbi:hypothetical protein KO525_07340 [Psychrosphaera sp. B3R10]|uniref:hypothetical protein n=1 Tax=unclassified Psychrosphaera TaxID=2641570 RepID=UPI001C0868BE|nr:MULTISPECIES: hypothetical protein [unclassified Psychrosphaera]MBU2881846.1 hypothetical protein [Psychrosphaera sp. I2R16]MBU2989182.1 hypothetical protein [Psychrosphaera sp. B3R10]MDO6720002.1 hypothetical protein [Psychrosphaera sp. 1_MG-2023]
MEILSSFYKKHAFSKMPITAIVIKKVARGYVDVLCLFKTKFIFNFLLLTQFGVVSANEIDSNTYSNNNLEVATKPSLTFDQGYGFVIETGLKAVNKNVKGIDDTTFDVRPYIQLGLYRPVADNWRVGSAINFAPNIVNSDTPALFNFKILDMFYLIDNKHSVSFYGGAQRQAREYTAWGYSLGFGYGYKLDAYTIRSNISWARTNTDIGGPGSETGAKDNLVWLNIGVEF